MKEKDQQSAERIYQDALLVCDEAYDKVKSEFSDVIDLDDDCPLLRIVKPIFKKGFSQGMNY